MRIRPGDLVKATGNVGWTLYSLPGGGFIDAVCTGVINSDDVGIVVSVIRRTGDVAVVTSSGAVGWCFLIDIVPT